ncbi:MAG: hypothetical protein H0X71_12390, partial [Rubrobacter sp.]|nr:hypothetical protein [Rubrobacter sp.]
MTAVADFPGKPGSIHVPDGRGVLVEAHRRWVEDYNAQDHFAHQDREDGRRSPREVLGWLTEVR